MRPSPVHLQPFFPLLALCKADYIQSSNPAYLLIPSGKHSLLWHCIMTWERATAVAQQLVLEGAYETGQKDGQKYRTSCTFDQFLTYLGGTPQNLFESYF